MDERLQKALDSANFMISFNNQKRILQEKYLTSCEYYHNGGSFTLGYDLINFVKVLLDTGNNKDVILIDNYNLPIQIEDLNSFFSDILDKFHQARNSFFNNFELLKRSRTVESFLL